MKIWTTAIAAAALTLAALPASAQGFAKPEDAVKYRQAAFTLTAAHFGPIGAMATGKAPFNAKVAADNAALVQQFSKLPWSAFGPGTDKGNHHAKPEVWSQTAKFKDEAQKYEAAAAKLATAAQGGSLDAVKAAFQDAAATCKSCHDSFKKK